MKKLYLITRTQITVFASVCLVAVAGLIYSSCNSDEDMKQETSDATAFVNYLNTNLDDVSKADISGKSVTRAGLVIEPKDKLTIYADFPAGTDKEFINACKDVKCVDDILRIQHATAAEFTLEKIPGCEISVSESELRKTYSGLLRESKEFLYKRGFTEAELQAMLKEENADELTLVTLAIVVSNSEANGLGVTAWNRNNSFDPLNLFVTPAYALTWGDVGNCALQAIGVDFITSGALSMGKKWAKDAIIKSFKAIAKRVIGPVGVAITVAEFGFCLLTH